MRALIRRVRHKQKHNFGEGCAQHESTQPLTLLPHKCGPNLGGVQHRRSRALGGVQDLRGVQAVPGGPGGSRVGSERYG